MQGSRSLPPVAPRRRGEVESETRRLHRGPFDSVARLFGESPDH